MYEYVAFVLVFIVAGVASKLNMRAIQENFGYHATWAIITAIVLGVIAAILPSPYPKTGQLDWGLTMAIVSVISYACGVAGSWIGERIIERG